jgi:Pentapeptide repeats (8 copies)
VLNAYNLHNYARKRAQAMKITNDTELSNASFVGAKLIRADFTDANLTGVDFTRADLTDATMPSSDNAIVWEEGDTLREWVIQTVSYYRTLHFFEQYSTLSDEELANTLKKLCLKEAYITGGNFEGRGDREVIRYDRQRILEVSLDALYGDDPGAYNFEYAAETLRSWSNISRGTFQSVDIQDAGKHLVKFTLNGMQHSVNPWEDPNELAPQINPLIAATGYQFEVWDLYPDCLVTVLTAQKKQQLRSEKNWSFH